MPAGTNRLPNESPPEFPSEVAPGLSGRLWPVHPHRQPDELLSSWIARTAYRNKIKIQTFTAITLGRQANVWTRDIDRSASDLLLSCLGEQTGSDVEELRGGMLTSLEGIISEHIGTSGVPHWILPLGIYHRTRRRYGLQFCPLCLFFDNEPYYRRRWRLAFSTVCDVHGTMLHDRCPECGAPVVFFRSELGRGHRFRAGSMVSCWQCGFDLRRAPTIGPDGPDGRTIMALRSICTFYDQGWWFQGEQAVHFAHLYFDVLHHLVKLLPTKYGLPLLREVEHATGWISGMQTGDHPVAFERKPVRDRHDLLVAALWLLERWPERFLGVGLRTRAAQSRILSGLDLPYWFASEVRKYLCIGRSPASSAEASAAAAYLTKRDKSVSMTAIGRLIGSKDGCAAHAYARREVAKPNRAELEKLIRVADQRSRGFPIGSRRRLLLLRDKTILQMIAVVGWTDRRVLDLSLRDALALAKTPRSPRTQSAQAAEVISGYLRSTRSLWPDPASSKYTFLTIFGDSLSADAWRARMRMLQSEACG